MIGLIFVLFKEPDTCVSFCTHTFCVPRKKKHVVQVWNYTWRVNKWCQIFVFGALNALNAMIRRRQSNTQTVSPLIYHVYVWCRKRVNREDLTPMQETRETQKQRQMTDRDLKHWHPSTHQSFHFLSQYNSHTVQVIQVSTIPPEICSLEQTEVFDSSSDMWKEEIWCRVICGFPVVSHWCSHETLNTSTSFTLSYFIPTGQWCMSDLCDCYTTDVWYYLFHFCLAVILYCNLSINITHTVMCHF